MVVVGGQIGQAWSGMNPELAGAAIVNGDGIRGGDTTTPTGDGTPTGGTPPPPTPMGQIIYGTPPQAYPSNITMGVVPADYNAPCCPINWWYVLLAAIVGGVVGYLASGHGRD